MDECVPTSMRSRDTPDAMTAGSANARMMDLPMFTALVTLFSPRFTPQTMLVPADLSARRQGVYAYVRTSGKPLRELVVLVAHRDARRDRVGRLHSRRRERVFLHLHPRTINPLSLFPPHAERTRRTVTLGAHTVRSSESAPTRSFGGRPVRFAYAASALCVNAFRASTPAQSGHRSCSMEKERRVCERGRVDGGACAGRGTETFCAAVRAMLRVRVRSLRVLRYMVGWGGARGEVR